LLADANNDRGPADGASQSRRALSLDAISAPAQPLQIRVGMARVVRRPPARTTDR
jgi:hypothetical protein